MEIGISRSGARERPARGGEGCASRGWLRVVGGGWARVGQRAKAEKESRGREREKRKGA